MDIDYFEYEVGYVLRKNHPLLKIFVLPCSKRSTSPSGLQRPSACRPTNPP